MIPHLHVLSLVAAGLYAAKKRNGAVTLLCQSMWHIVGTQWTVGNRMNHRAGAAGQLLHAFDLVSLLGQETKSLIFCLLQASLACLLLWFSKFQNNVARPEITLQCFLEHSCCPPFLQWLRFSSLCASCRDSLLSLNLYARLPQRS